MVSHDNNNVLTYALHKARHIIYFAIAFSFVYNMLRLAGPLFIILIYDRVLPSQSEATLTALFLLVVLLLLVMTMIDYSRRRILARFGAQFQEIVEDRIFSTTKRDSFSNANGGKPTDGLDQLDRLRDFFHSRSLVTVLDFVWSPIFLVAIFFIHWIIGWVVLGGLALLALIVTASNVFAKGRKERFTKASNKTRELKDRMIASRDVIHTHNMMATFNDRWVDARRVSRDKAVELRDWSTWFSILSTHTAMLMQYSVLAVGAYLALSSQLTMGAMVACMFLSVRVFYPVERFVKQIPRIGEAVADWKSLDAILKANKTTYGEPGVGARPILAFVGLQIRSPLTKQKLLRTVNTEIEPGTVVEIVGKSGSGKTVLAEAILGRVPLASGKITIGGRDIGRLSLGQAADAFGYVPQQVRFIDGTIAENIAHLQLTPDRARLVEVATSAQLHEMIQALPNGYDTLIDAAASRFSKGERHQLALARALYLSPKVLIVDEPDQVFRDGLSKNLKDLVSGFLAGGGILVIFSRKEMKTFKSHRRFSLVDGMLREGSEIGSPSILIDKPVNNVVKLGVEKRLENKIAKAGDEKRLS